MFFPDTPNIIVPAVSILLFKCVTIYRYKKTHHEQNTYSSNIQTVNSSSFLFLISFAKVSESPF